VSFKKAVSRFDILKALKRKLVVFYSITKHPLWNWYWEQCQWSSLVLRKKFELNSLPL